MCVESGYYFHNASVDNVYNVYKSMGKRSFLIISEVNLYFTLVFGSHYRQN